MMNTNNPEMSAELAKILEWVRESADKASGFAVEQAPLLAQEFVTYTLWSSLLWIGFSILLIIVFGICVRVLFKSGRGNLSQDAAEGRQIIATIVGFISFFLSIMVFTTNANNAIKAIVAPRVLIVEKISDIIN